MHTGFTWQFVWILAPSNITFYIVYYIPLNWGFRLAILNKAVSHLLALYDNG